jgi:NAD(P)-dependent dehydrogenase (short-subunit alcohol dehydrogenase family)/acyl carrier protein
VYPTPDDVEELWREIWAENSEQRVALRDGQRFVARLVSYAGPDAAGQEKLQRNEGLRADGTYLISGGLGALGLLVADWMIRQGAGNLVLVGRSGARPEVQETLARLQENGKVAVLQGDISQAQDVKKILDQVQETMPPLKGVVHAAGVLDDGVLSEQTWERFEKVLAPKLDGAWNLHQFTQDTPLDFFVMFSSAASLLGSAGQGNYVAANAFLDSLAHYRRKRGLAAASINWGPWGQAGMAVNVQDRLARQGLKPLPPELGLMVLEKAILEDIVQVGVIDCDWQKYAAQALEEDRNGFFSELLKQTAPTRQTGPGERESQVLLELTRAVAEERNNILKDFIQGTAAAVIGYDSQELDVGRSLMEQGFDSLMAVQLRTVLGKSLSESLPATLLFNYPTVNDIADYLLGQVLKLDAAARPPDQPSAADEFGYLDDLSAQELEALIEQELDGV